MLKKKFKVKVVHYVREHYSIEYCHYRLIPIWRELHYWFSILDSGSTHCWSTQLGSYKKMETIAKTLVDRGNVDGWYEEQNKIRKEFFERRNEYFKDRIPYEVKIFS